MTIEALTIVIAIGQGLMSLIFFGMVPWAMRVVRELGEIRTALESMGWQEDAITELRQEVNGLKVRLAEFGG